MRVKVEVEEVDLENENGESIGGVRALCSHCGHETESFGTGDPSVKRCLALLQDECPGGETNFYVDARNE